MLLLFDERLGQANHSKEVLVKGENKSPYTAAGVTASAETYTTL